MTADAHLIDGEPVVGARVVEVDQAHVGGAHLTVGTARLHRDAVDQQSVDAEVLGDLGLRLGTLQALDGFVDQVGVVGVDATGGGAEPAEQVDLIPRRSLRRDAAGPDGGAELCGVADLTQVVQGGRLDDGLVEGDRHAGPPSRGPALTCGAGEQVLVGPAYAGAAGAST